MVSMFNGMGGACAALISVVEFNHLLHEGITAGAGTVLIIVLGLLIGGISFSGSIIAWGKLNGTVKDLAFRGQNLLNLLVLAVAVAIAGYLVLHPGEYPYLLYALLACSLIYGILFVLPIGGADMPVVISLLNSFTGVAAACGGFLYDNKVMLTGGILVGAAGTLLTILMCKAMNRSLINVLVGSFGGGGGSQAAAANKEQGNYKEISLSDTAMVMAYANKVYDRSRIWTGGSASTACLS